MKPALSSLPTAVALIALAVTSSHTLANGSGIASVDKRANNNAISDSRFDDSGVQDNGVQNKVMPVAITQISDHSLGKSEDTDKPAFIHKPNSAPSATLTTLLDPITNH